MAASVTRLCHYFGVNRIWKKKRFLSYVLELFVLRMKKPIRTYQNRRDVLIFSAKKSRSGVEVNLWSVLGLKKISFSIFLSKNCSSPSPNSMTQINYLTKNSCVLETILSCICKSHQTRNATRCNNRKDLLHLSFTLKISIFS